MGAELIAGWEAEVALGLLVLTFASFLLERYPPEVTATISAAVFILLGLVPETEVMEVFSNSAPITIAAMFVISGALVRTGLLDALAGAVIARAETQPVLGLGVFFGAALVASAFVNNTPVVLVLIPVVIRLAQRLDLAATRFLIPLSYVAILGGTCSLIGTSTNILVDGVARDLGLEPFGIFEVAPVGLCLAAAGVGVLLVLGPLLLPDRRGLNDSEAAGEARFLTEVRVLEGYAGIGEAVGTLADFKRPGLKVTGFRTGGTIRRADVAGHELSRGDILILQATTSELLTLRDLDGLEVGLRRGLREEPGELEVAEAIVTPGRGTEGERIADLGIGHRYGMRVLGAHRHGHLMGPDLPSARLRPADKVLLEGPAEGFSRMAEAGDLVSITTAGGRAYRRRRAPVAALALVGVVILAAFNVAPIGLLALLAVALILALRCIDGDEAWGAIDGSILILIFAMLVIGSGLEQAGALERLVSWIAPLIDGLPPIVTLAAVYAMASILTELVTNNAVAVILTPLAAGLAAQIGVDPRPFVVAVMMGASASFATPIGYQTNTLVYGAGNYRFTDFLKIGLPMNLTVGIVAVIVIPIFFPLG